MKIKSIYIAITVLFFLNVVRAQQDPNYTFYKYNMNLINPAFAGTSEMSDLGINYRSQWASIEGAPETQSVFFGTPIKKNLGLGVSIINDKTFIENQVSLSMDFSYKVQLDELNELFFGLKAGFNSYRANTAGLATYGIQSDPSLMNLDGRFNPNIGAGVYLKNEAYFLSFSMPKLLTPSRLENNDGTARLSDDRIHVYLAGGHDFPLSSTIMFKPVAMIRYVNASPLSLDVTALFEFSNQVELGVAHRLNESISALFIFKINELFDIGYAYETAVENTVSNINNGTHEIMLNLKF